jgi:putative transposase
MSAAPQFSDFQDAFGREYDYARDEVYFVTICAFQESPLFGEITGGQMQLNACGELVQCEWLRLQASAPFLSPDAFVVMPNHVHGILALRNLHGDTWARGSFEWVIAGFKLQTTLQANTLRGTSGEKIWQRNSYDRLIQNARDLDYLRQYIDCNPTRWQTDEYYTAAPARPCEV